MRHDALKSMLAKAGQLSGFNFVRYYKTLTKHIKSYKYIYLQICSSANI